MSENKKIKSGLKTFLWTLTSIATIVGVIFSQDDIKDFIGFKSKSGPEISRPSPTTSFLNTAIGTTSPPPIVAPPALKSRIVSEGKPIFWEDAKTQMSISFQVFEGEEFVRVILLPAGMPLKKIAVLNGSEDSFESSSGEYQLQILDIDYLNKKAYIQVSSKLLTTE